MVIPLSKTETFLRQLRPFLGDSFDTLALERVPCDALQSTLAEVFEAFPRGATM